MLEFHDGLVSNTKVNSKEKKLIMDRSSGFLGWNSDKYVYSLDGWAGRYGMPLSFSLALHLSTMKPDLVTNIINTFDTTVHINQFSTSIKVVPIFKDADGNEYTTEGTTEDSTEVNNYKSIQKAIDAGKISQDLWDKIQSTYEQDQAYIYQPYIDRVEEHWYYDKIDFSDAYEESSEEYYKKYRSSDPEGVLKDEEEFSGELWLEEYGLEPRMVQVKQPEVSGPNQKILDIFSESYYTYDGSEKTADMIHNGTATKKPVEFNKKDALEAFSILENCKDLDSQYIYRDLKKLLIELEYFTEEDFEKPDTQVLKWVLNGYKPPKWPQRENEYSHGAILYSKATKDREREEREAQEQEEETETNNEESIGATSSNKKKEDKGFEAEKSVTSPGKGEIIKISTDSITIKFTEPEVVLDFTMKISGFAVNGELKEGDPIEQRAEIGKTTDSDLKIVLKDNKGSIIDHIEEYMSPKSPIESDYAMFYWSPYESGGWDNKDEGPESVGGISDTEKAVGFAQWTTIGDLNNVGELMKYAYDSNHTLCEPLAECKDYSINQVISDINSGESSRIRTAFRTICANDREEFLKIQIAKKKEEFANSANDHHAEWLVDAPSIVQGTVMAMWNYGSGLWTDRIKQTNSDQENLIITMGHSASVESTAGSLQARFESQYAMARDILNGVISEEELEEWVRKGTGMDKYVNGRNPGVLSGYVY